MTIATACGLLICLVGCALLMPSIRTNLALLRRMRHSHPLGQGLPPDDGPATLNGAADGTALTAPLSGQPCVLWQVEIDQIRNGLPWRRWKPLYRQTSGEHLTVSSGTLLAHVHVTDTRLFLADTLHVRQGRLTPLSAALRVRLHQLGVPSEGPLGLGRRLHVVERLVAPGQQVFVQGEVEQIGGVPHLLGSPTAPLILADRSEGQLLEELWRNTAASVALAMGLGVLALILALMLIS